MKGVENVQLNKATVSNLPFPDNYFDFGFSLGVLHHVPDTGKAMKDCVSKIKPGGYFLVYLYYSLDNRGFFYRALFGLSNLLRKIVSRMPTGLKKFSCNVLAVFLYMPFILLSRFMKFLGFPKRIRARIPLHTYEPVSFYIIRNDSLDRFGTPLEQRFSRQQIDTMMKDAGLENVVFSEKAPYWHAVGQKKK
jgi:SAM-dependent methyltransferase